MPETSSANADLPRRARIWSLRWQEGDSERESAARSLELALGIRPLTARLLCTAATMIPPLLPPSSATAVCSRMIPSC